MKKRVVIYCASGYAERVAYSLNEDTFEVIGLTDSNPEIWGKRLYGYEVYPPGVISELKPDLVVIAISEYETEIRTLLIEKYGMEADKITVYQGQTHDIRWEEERIVMLRKCIAMLKERNIKGNMAEVGVYQGDFAKLFNRYFPEKKLYLFDTFEGFDTERDKVNDCDKNLFKDTSVEFVLQKMTTPEQCIVKKGYFPDTAVDVDETFSLVSLDCDLYEPILAGLEYFYPRLSKGGYIFVHDFGSYHFEEVKKAVLRYCDENNVSLFPIVDRCLSVIITK